jgi:hypothetical protein
MDPYPQRGAPSPTRGDQAFLRVRISDDLKPSGYIAVYLDNGTQLFVRANDLLRFDRAPSS